MNGNVTKTKFAQSLNLDRGYVTKLIKKGLPVNSDGSIPKAAATRWYRDNIISKSKKQPLDGEAENQAELAEDITRVEADRKLTIAKARLADLEYQKARGKLVEADAIAEVWAAHISAARSRLLMMPTGLASRLARETDPIACERILKESVDLALTELSQTDVVPS